MPKIAAGTVKEHREQVQTALVDAAEEILRSHRELTAGEVTRAAGIARNSIYRYVDSVDDLRGLVLARHLPRWLEAVESAVSDVTAPREQVLVWARANLEQAVTSGHGWLVDVARGLRNTGVDTAHDTMEDVLARALCALGSSQVELDTAVVRAMVDAGFRRLDAGDPQDVVVPRVTGVVSAVLDTIG